MGAHFLPVEEGQEIESCDHHRANGKEIILLCDMKV